MSRQGDRWWRAGYRAAVEDAYDAVAAACERAPSITVGDVLHVLHELKKVNPKGEKRTKRDDL